MEEWQVKALEVFPELREEIERILSPTALWIELYEELRAAYYEEPVNDELIKRIYDFAAWCFKQPSTNNAETDPSSAAAVGLMEDIPLDPRVAADLYRWISVDTFDGCESLFRYLLSESEYQAFREQFMRKKKDYQGPSAF